MLKCDIYHSKTFSPLRSCIFLSLFNFFHAVFHLRFADDIPNNGMPKGVRDLLTGLTFVLVGIAYMLQTP